MAAVTTYGTGALGVAGPVVGRTLERGGRLKEGRERGRRGETADGWSDEGRG
jgi:hypothetical protein